MREQLPPAGATNEQIAKHYLYRVMEAEDQNLGCGKTGDPDVRPLFCCQWNNRELCGECAELERRIIAYAAKCIEAAHLLSAVQTPGAVRKER